jgi:hypothetical protein
MKENLWKMKQITIKGSPIKRIHDCIHDKILNPIPLLKIHRRHVMGRGKNPKLVFIPVKGAVESSG